MLTFEVRVPTYNRPDLLARALQSLQTQTYPHWVATVYDDATAGEETVRFVADDRIRYQRNHQKLGACANIDKCFSPFSENGGTHGYVLEDDNFLLPGFFSLIAEALQAKPWRLIQANQRIWSKARGMHPLSETTRGLWFRPGTVDVLHLQASLLFMEGLSNGGMIWQLDSGCNFQVGPSVQHFGIQEACRTLLVNSPFLFIDEPLAVFTYMPRIETARGSEDDRSVGRGLQSIRRYILKHLGSSVLEAIPPNHSLKDHINSLLVHSGYPHLIAGRMSATLVKVWLKGIVLRLTQHDPCARFLANLDRDGSPS
jgi:hypothetical protein